MRTEFTGRQTEIDTEVRRLCDRKLAKIAKLLPSLARARVILTVERHRQIAEISVHSRHCDLSAVGVSTKARTSVADAFEKLLRQAQRERTRRRVRKGAATPRLAGGSGAEAGGDGSLRRVVRSRRSPIKPMTLEEATLEIEEQREGVLVFRDASSGRVTLLFRRRDGNLGLIEPEA